MMRQVARYPPVACAISHKALSVTRAFSICAVLAQKVLII